MKLRIVLSVLLLLGLCVSACDATYGGISTSPSDPGGVVADDDPAPAQKPPQPEAFPPCGLWHRGSAALADAASLAGEPPDLIVFTVGGASCSDAQTMGEYRWPGQVFVRRVAQHWTAYEAP